MFLVSDVLLAKTRTMMTNEKDSSLFNLHNFNEIIVMRAIAIADFVKHCSRIHKNSWTDLSA